MDFDMVVTPAPAQTEDVDYATFRAGVAGTSDLVVMQFEYAGLALRTSSDQQFDSFMRPFSYALWVLILGCIVGIGATLQLLEYVWPSDSAMASETSQPHKHGAWGHASVRHTLHLVYHMFALFLQVDDYEWLTLPLRILKLGVAFVVLVLVSTYTANLAAFFSMPSFSVGGPASMAELKNMKACIADPIHLTELSGFVATAVIPPNASASQRERLTSCVELLKAREVDVVLDIFESLNTFAALRSCQDVAWAMNGQRFGSSRYQVAAWAVPPANPQWVSDAMFNLTQASAFLANTYELKMLQVRHFGDGTYCNEPPMSDTPTIDISDMYGLFVVLGVACAVSLFAALTLRVGGLGRAVMKSEAETATETAVEVSRT